MRHVNIVKVEAVANIGLWKKYCTNRSDLVERLQACRGCPWVDDLVPEVAKFQDAFPHIKLERSANEVLLLHGTPAQTALQIAQEGFDDRLSRPNALYGTGIYLSTDPCKIMKYCGKDSRGFAILSRVLIGYPYMAQGPMKEHKRPPKVEGHHVLHDSIIARPGIPNNQNGGTQTHWEFVAREKVYPELIIEFEYSTW